MPHSREILGLSDCEIKDILKGDVITLGANFLH